MIKPSGWNKPKPTPTLVEMIHEAAKVIDKPDYSQPIFMGPSASSILLNNKKPPKENFDDCYLPE
jgi:hypothetical protein